MDHFSVNDHARNALNTQAGDFILGIGPVNHFVLEVSMDKCHLMKCLHHIRAVFTGEGNVCLDADRAFECADASLQSSVRHLTLPV